jgi:uncharacterized phiE125 gp8 family phage protein
MLQNLERITAPTLPLIPLADAKAHLRVTHNAEDGLIATYATAVEAHLDGASGILARALMPQKWRLTLCTFPCGAIRLPLPPFGGVTAFEWDDEAGNTAAVAADTYRVRMAHGVALLEPKLFWPHCAYAVRVEYTCGYASNAEIAANIKAAALIMLAELYENRAPADSRIENSAVDRLLATHRVPLWL